MNRVSWNRENLVCYQLDGAHHFVAGMNKRTRLVERQLSWPMPLNVLARSHSFTSLDYFCGGHYKICSVKNSASRFSRS